MLPYAHLSIINTVIITGGVRAAHAGAYGAASVAAAAAAAGSDAPREETIAGEGMMN